MFRLTNRYLLILASVAITLLVGLSPLTGLESGPGIRFLYAMRGMRTPPSDVLIVSLDSRAASALGLPRRITEWSRANHAALVDGLAASGAAAIGFDVLFERARDPVGDAAFARALRRAGTVVLAEAVSRQKIVDSAGREVASIEHRTLPLSLFGEAAHGTAPFILPKSDEGVFEYWTHLPGAGNRPSMPLALAKLLPEDARSGVQALRAAPVSHRLALNLYGPLGRIPTLSYDQALKVLEDPLEARRRFAGKAIIVGLSEPNQSLQADAYRTPYSGPDGVDVSGVELCATALANLLDASYLRRPGPIVELAGLLAWSVVLMLAWLCLAPRMAMFATLLALGGYALGAVSAFGSAHLWLPVVLPLVIIPGVVVGLGLGAHYRRVRIRQADLERAMEHGLSRQAFERLEGVLGGMSAGRTVFAVCMCSDIEGYTTISEALSPKATRDVLNRYLEMFIPRIEASGGYVADIVGDSVMSVWLADASPSGARDGALRATLELDACMNGDKHEPGALPTRFGLHFGQVFLGEVGSDKRREIRAVGDIVNTASRVQTANKLFGTWILASEGALPEHRSDIARFAGRFVLKGKRQSLALYQLSSNPAALVCAPEFEHGLAAFVSGDFDTAVSFFERALASRPEDGICAYYLGLSRQLVRSGAGPEWDGSVVLSSK